MQHDLLVYIDDILSSIEAIENYLSSLDFEKYNQNRMVKRAVERELEIIGEATNSILKRNDKTPISESRKIVDLRNLISHSYSSVNDRMIWSIVQNKIKVLKKEILEWKFELEKNQDK